MEFENLYSRIQSDLVALHPTLPIVARDANFCVEVCDYSHKTSVSGVPEPQRKPLMLAFPFDQECKVSDLQFSDDGDQLFCAVIL